MFITAIFANQKVVNFNKNGVITSSLLYNVPFRVSMFLNVLDFFIEQNRKTSTLRSFKVNENKYSGIQRIKFSKFLQNVWKHSFFFPLLFLFFYVGPLSH